MASRSKSQSPKAAPAPIVVVALVVVLVLFVGWLAYAHLLAGPAAQPLSAQAKSNNDRLRTLAKQSGGDISKLSEEDRNWVNNNAGGYGAMVLQKLANENK